MSYMSKLQKTETRKFIRIGLIFILITIFFSILSSFVLSDLFEDSYATWEKHPKEVAAKHYVIADRSYKKGKIGKAIRNLKKAIDLDVSNENYINRLAQIYHEQGKYRQALNYLTKTRELIQDFEPKQSVQMINWEGCYSLSYGLRSESIQRFETAIHLMNKYEIVDSLLKASIYCNWGVAELYDQGKDEPCDTTVLGECYKIHITDVRRATQYFREAISYNPEECYRAGRWNYALTKEMLKISKDTLTKYYGYLPKHFIRDIIIASQDTFCPIPIPVETVDDIPKDINLTTFKNIPKYKEVLYVMDISGSMVSAISDKNETSRFDLMVRLIANEVQSADSTQRIGMLTVGGNCPTDPLVRIQVDTSNHDQLLSTLYSMQPFGGTPIYNTLINSPQYFTDEKNEKIILLASDGIESCVTGESVCQLADELCNQGIKIEVFSLLLDERSNYDAYGLYQCMSDACQTEFTAVNETGKIEDKMIQAPIDYYSMTINREDLLTSIYEVTY